MVGLAANGFYKLLRLIKLLPFLMNSDNVDFLKMIRNTTFLKKQLKEKVKSFLKSDFSKQIPYH